MQKGTWSIAAVSDALCGNYVWDGKTERLPRGTTAANLAERVPAGATDVQTAEANNRNEIFVTVGAPTTTLFTPTGKGIELVPVTHPNDLFAGESATFQFLLDGKPAAGLRSEEHTSELQSLMRISYAVCCLKKKKT